jgi:chromate transporter
MACHVGHGRAGLLGSLTAGLCFTLPAAVISTLLAWGYQRYGTLPEVGPYLAGIQPVVLGLLATAICRLAWTALRSWQAAAVAAGVLAASLWGAEEVATLFAGMAAGALLLRLTRRDTRPPAGPAAAAAVGAITLSGGAAQACAAGTAATAAGTAALGAAASVPLWKLGLFFLKVGAVLYGSGYVLIAYLQGGLVHDYQWLTEQQLLDAVAAGQITPGPLISTAAFIGYLLAGLPGAGLATAAIILPSFVFVAIVNPWVARLRQWRWTAIILDAVNAASLGLMAAVCCTLGQAALGSPAGWTLAIAAAAVSLRWKIAPAWLVLAGAVAGRVLAL